MYWIGYGKFSLTLISVESISLNYIVNLLWSPSSISLFLINKSYITDKCHAESFLDAAPFHTSELRWCTAFHPNGLSPAPSYFFDVSSLLSTHLISHYSLMSIISSLSINWISAPFMAPTQLMAIRSKTSIYSINFAQSLAPLHIFELDSWLYSTECPHLLDLSLQPHLQTHLHMIFKSISGITPWRYSTIQYNFFQLHL